MTTSAVVDLTRQVFMTTFWLSVPVLAAGFVIGILVSLAQILTSIQDSSFSTVPRLTVFLVTLLVALPWMFTQLIDYTTSLFANFGRFAR
jgi:flagellar biosynthetic protein FliQ